jgi:hypothetical protein
VGIDACCNAPSSFLLYAVMILRTENAAQRGDLHFPNGAFNKLGLPHGRM